MCLDGEYFVLFKHNKVAQAYLEDFDETERAEPSSAWHQAKRRVVQ